MSAIDLEVTDAPGRPYSEGCDARADAKPRDANPDPPDSKDHAFWLGAWSYFDELNGGGPRIPADYSNAPVFDVWEFEHFLVVPVVEVNGARPPPAIRRALRNVRVRRDATAAHPLAAATS